MSIDTPKSSPQEWWRWVALPFATIAGAIIGSFLMGLFLWFGMKLQGGFSEDGWYFRYVMPVISSVIFGYLYSTIAVEVAPRGKIIAGTVMVTILGLIAAISLFISWFTLATPVGEKIQITIGSMATMIAAILTLVDANGR